MLGSGTALATRLAEPMTAPPSENRQGKADSSPYAVSTLLEPDMKQSSFPTLIILATMVPLSTLGCAFEGEERELQMRYVSTFLDFLGTDPMAVGASAALRVRDRNDSELSIVVTHVDSSDSEVIAPEGFEDDLVILHAASEGEITLTVHVEREDMPVSDDFTIRAAEATRLEIKDACTSSEDEEFVYLTDRTIDLPFRLYSDETRLAGYGYYPVTLEPQGLATVLPLDVIGRLRLDTHAAGELTLESTIGESSHVLRLIEESDIDDIDVEQAFEAETVPPHSPLPVLLGAFSNGKVACQPRFEVQAESLSPEVCRVVDRDEIEESFANYETLLAGLYPNKDLVLLETLSEGTCSFRITLPNVLDGEGFVVEQSIEVVE